MIDRSFLFMLLSIYGLVSTTLSVVKCVFMVSIRIGKSVASRTVTFALQYVLCPSDSQSRPAFGSLFCFSGLVPLISRKVFPW